MNSPLKIHLETLKFILSEMVIKFEEIAFLILMLQRPNFYLCYVIIFVQFQNNPMTLTGFIIKLLCKVKIVILR